MSKLYITEYAEIMLGLVGRVTQVPMEPPIAEQVVDYSGGVTASTALNANTQLVRIHTDAICSVLFGTAPVATTGKGRMVAGATEYRGVPRGASFKVSAITNT